MDGNSWARSLRTAVIALGVFALIVGFGLGLAAVAIVIGISK